MQPAFAADLKITVAGIARSEGNVMVAVYNNPEAMAARQAIARTQVRAAGPEVSAVFSDLGVGRYAIVVFHDENGNQKLDANLLGQPQEPYGFSNDAQGSFGPPTFEACAIVLGATEQTVRVLLRK